MSNNINANYLEIFNNLNDQKLHRNSNVLIIDGLNTFLRSFAVNPTLNDNGHHVGGVVGFFKSVGAAIKKFSPTRVIIVFDGSDGSQRRRKLLPEYKENRKNKLRVNRAYDLHTEEDERESMKRQIVEVGHLLRELPVTTIVLDHIEADDVISYLCTNVFTNDDNIVTIMSSDKDFLQLVNERITVWAPSKKKVYTPEEVFAEYGVTPKNYLILRVFSGDVSDNIKGIKGVGKKTLIKYFPILKEYQDVSVDQVISLAEDSDKKLKIFEKIREGKEVLDRNYRLMQLYDVDISGNNKLKIISAASRPVPKMNRVTFITTMNEIGVLEAFPNVHNWLQDTFLRLNRFREDSL